jgi:hypothetical protein
MVMNDKSHSISLNTNINEINGKFFVQRRFQEIKREQNDNCST